MVAPYALARDINFSSVFSSNLQINASDVVVCLELCTIRKRTSLRASVARRPATQPNMPILLPSWKRGTMRDAFHPRAETHGRHDPAGLAGMYICISSSAAGSREVGAAELQPTYVHTDAMKIPRR